MLLRFVSFCILNNLNIYNIVIHMNTNIYYFKKSDGILLYIQQYAGTCILRRK